MVLLGLLRDVKDPRRAQGQRFKLAPFSLSIVLSVLSGATSFRKMVLYIALQRVAPNQPRGTQWQGTPS